MCTSWRWGREDYYTREIARNREEYLSGHGESPGVFHGGSARALGLEGECSPEGFKRLFAWQDPRTGAQLGRAPRQDAMPAWDLVLRPHKDVSILYALGDEATGRRVAAAHQAGVRAAVAYLDSQVGTRTGRHGAEHVQGEGLLAVGFTHRTSRAGDPLLHTHLIVTNRTQGPDGGWRTLDSRDLLNHRAAADAMYQAAYQQELTRSLGVGWEAPDRWGNRAVQGMPEELRRGFSKRHEQISAELERQEALGKRRTPRLVQKVVHQTRPAKSHETPETWYGRWQQEARDLGVEPERLVRQVTGRERSREHDPARTTGHDSVPAAAPGGTAGQDRPAAAVAGTPAGLPERTITRVFDRLASPEGLTAQVSTFTRREVLCAVGRELPVEAVGMVGPAELEALADRFLADRALSVVSEHAIGERHYATPEILEVERRLLDAAVSRSGEQTATCSHDTLRATLAAHPTIGADQAAMVRDITQGGQGVALVVGKAGTGKTYALGVARHAWQLDGYRVLGAAPTGIATVCLDAEGFERSRTVDALLAELDAERAAQGRCRPGGRQPNLTRKRQPPPGRDTSRINRERDQDQDERVLDARTVLVVDEAGMVGSRKLARLLDDAAEARCKIVLVGDDKQLAAIEAGGGFRGLRLRLGASELSENRRQAEPWEREAVEHLREGSIEMALHAYRGHDRLVATETPGQLKETMLSDWWQSFQHGNRVVILAHRRDEVDQFNTACQQLRDANGELGAERLQVRDRSFAVGDQVVCGKNAIKALGVANGSRGQVVAVDPEQRAMTLKLEDGREVRLPTGYLDKRPARWVGNNPDRRTVDLAYASTGHKSQGGTWDDVLLRVTGSEDRQWLHVGGSRGIGRTRYYSVISPEPAGRQDRDREREQVDVPAADRTEREQAEQMATVARRDHSKRLAADTTAVVDGRRMSKHDLRAELHRLQELADKAPRDQSRLLALATRRREQHDQRLAEATTRRQDARDLVALLEHGPARFLRRGDFARAREQAKQAEQAYQVARQAADRAADRERDARQQQQQYQAHQEANPEVREQHRELLRVQAWRKRADARAVEVLRPEWSRELGERPATVKGGRTWDRAVEQTIEYRQRWSVEDAEHPLGREPHGPDASLAQRQAWRHATSAVGRLRDLADDRTDRAERGDHREATSRSDQPGDQVKATGRSDHRGDRRQRLLGRERDHDHERAV